MRVKWIIAIVLQIALTCWAQAQSRSSNAVCGPGSDPLVAILKIMNGSPLDSLERFVAPYAVVLHGSKQTNLKEVLHRPDRSDILNEDSTRIGSLDLRPSESGDAVSVILRTTSREGTDTHLHSVLLLRDSKDSLRIALWHVGG